MTKDDEALRDQLTLSELDPHSTQYRQRRLAQTLGRFKANAKSADERINIAMPIRSSVADDREDAPKRYPCKDQSQLNDQDDLDLWKALEEHRVEVGRDEG